MDHAVPFAHIPEAHRLVDGVGRVPVGLKVVVEGRDTVYPQRLVCQQPQARLAIALASLRGIDHDAHVVLGPLGIQMIVHVPHEGPVRDPL